MEFKEPDMRRRHRNLSHIVVTKSLDESFFASDRMYTVFLHDHPDAKRMGDYGKGTNLWCLSACSGTLTFVKLKDTMMYDKFKSEVLSINTKEVDEYGIEFLAWENEDEILDLIDRVKHNPDKYHGKAYYDEEIEISDQDKVEGEALFKDFFIKYNKSGNVYPLIIEDRKSDVVYNEKHFSFNIPQLWTISSVGDPIRLSIKRKHKEDYKTYDDLRLRVRPEGGFDIYRTDELGNPVHLDTFFPGDILSYVKGIHIEVFPFGYDFKSEQQMTINEFKSIADQFDIPIVTDHQSNSTEAKPCEETKTDDDYDLPDPSDFYIKDVRNILKNKNDNIYPLFIKDDLGRLIINYDLLCNFMNMDNVEIKVICRVGERSYAWDVYKPDELYVHVGGTTLTCTKRKNESTPVKMSGMEIRSGDWKTYRSVYVEIRPCKGEI